MDEGERRSGRSVQVLSFSYRLLFEDRTKEEKGKEEERGDERAVFLRFGTRWIKGVGRKARYNFS